tara:strand:- start:350 stop:718 length:369 start_codon:yes stop_codon:yes gene_type:complete
MALKSILIIDDDLSILETVKKILNLKGFKVLTASNGEAGLSMVKNENDIGLILLDLMMPVMDGFEFLESRAQDRELADIPVIVLSAGEDRPNAKNYDIHKVISKPFRFNQLLKEIEVIGLGN